MLIMKRVRMSSLKPSSELMPCADDGELGEFASAVQDGKIISDIGDPDEML